MKEKVSGKAKIFSEELNKAVKKIASQYGYHAPEFSVLEHDLNLFINISLYQENPHIVYEKLYLQNYEKIGLKKEWLNSYFVTPKKHKKMKIIGFDIDGGDNFIKTIDEDGKYHFFDPDSIIYLVSNHASI